MKPKVCTAMCTTKEEIGFRAVRVLRNSGQVEQAKELSRRLFKADTGELSIISEYVELVGHN